MLSPVRITIAIEVPHQWAEQLPLRDKILVCINCGQVKPIVGDCGETLPCAELKAWQIYGATARGDYLVVPPEVIDRWGS